MTQTQYAVVAGCRIPAAALSEAGLGWERFADEAGWPLELRFVPPPVNGPSWSLPLPSGEVSRLRRVGDGWEAERRTLLENRAVLRQVLAASLLDHKSLLLHAAGVVVDGRAWLFLGSDGAGKTTIAMRSGRKLLSDDVVAVKMPEGIAMGTPFTSDAGQTGHPEEAPLAGLVRLSWRESPHVDRLGQRAAFETLVGSAFVPPGDEARMLRAVDLAGALATQVSAFCLAFPKDYVFDPRDFDVP